MSKLLPTTSNPNQVIEISSCSPLFLSVSVVRGCTPAGLPGRQSPGLCIRGRDVHYGMRRQAHVFGSKRAVESLDGGTLWN